MKGSRYSISNPKLATLYTCITADVQRRVYGNGRVRRTLPCPLSSLSSRVAMSAIIWYMSAICWTCLSTPEPKWPKMWLHLNQDINRRTAWLRPWELAWRMRLTPLPLLYLVQERQLDHRTLLQCLHLYVYYELMCCASDWLLLWGDNKIQRKMRWKFLDLQWPLLLIRLL